MLQHQSHLSVANGKVPNSIDKVGTHWHLRRMAQISSWQISEELYARSTLGRHMK